MTTTKGTAALTKVLQAIPRLGSGQNPREAAEAMWPDFVAAVSHAMSEERTREFEGVQAWRADRHRARQ